MGDLKETTHWRLQGPLATQEHNTFEQATKSNEEGNNLAGRTDRIDVGYGVPAQCHLYRDNGPNQDSNADNAAEGSEDNKEC